MFSQIQQIQNIQPFPQKLCPVFSTSHVAAQFRNPEAVQETSLVFLPPAHTQTHPHSHQVRTHILHHRHLLAHPVHCHATVPLWASLLLCFTPEVPPCLQACFSMYFLPDDHLQAETGHLENLPQASGIRFKLISFTHLINPSWQASAFASSFFSSTVTQVTQNGLLYLLNYPPARMSSLFPLANHYLFFQNIYQWQLLHLALTDPLPSNLNAQLLLSLHLDDKFLEGNSSLPWSGILGF